MNERFEEMTVLRETVARWKECFEGDDGIPARIVYKALDTFLAQQAHAKDCDCGGFDRNGSHDAGEYVGYCADSVTAAFRARGPYYDRLYLESAERAFLAVAEALAALEKHKS